jgi:hypothetical protein
MSAPVTETKKQRCPSIAPGCNAQCGLPAGHYGLHQNGLRCRTWADTAPEIPAPVDPEEKEMLWGDKGEDCLGC